LGGLAATHELYAAGATRRTLAKATESGELRRVRQGWYCEPELSPSLFACARIGGVATCLTAAQHWGLWLPVQPDALHVAVHSGACQLRDPGDHHRRLSGGDQVVHWTDPTDVTGHAKASRLIHRPVDAIRDLIRCQDVETVFVIVESALTKRVLTRHELESLLWQSDAAARIPLWSANRHSGSGIESLFVFRIRRRGVVVRQQVQIGPDRVDCLIGDDLIVELDSREFHDPATDSIRDARLFARGYRVIRIRYAQVMYNWPSVEAAIFGALACRVVG
jgi:very-short-patch-repair endonuclease